MPIKYNGELITLAKNLRKNATAQEKHLWYDFLSNYPVKFQRQKVIDRFIVDFYCHQAKLVIELDGAQHYENLAIIKDSLRTNIIEGYGIEVIRFTNHQIDRQFNTVCEQIDFIVNERIKAKNVQS
jgi:very-short-patch-repair endonuclease